MEKVDQAGNITARKVTGLEIRTRLPLIVRFLAVAAFIVTLIVIGVAFYRSRGNESFVMKGMPTQLSKDVVAVVNSYERKEVEGDTLKYYIKADRATTFSDNHQELENVYLEAYDEKGEKFDRISAQKAIYIPDSHDTKLFNAFFSGAVTVESRDGLQVKSEQISYDRSKEIAQSETDVEFFRNNVAGRSTGATLWIAEKRLELQSNVEINANQPADGAENELSDANLQQASLKAGRAVFDQQSEKIDLETNVFIGLIPRPGTNALSQPTDIRADKATAFFQNKVVRKFELNGSVEVYAKPTVRSGKYTKANSTNAVATFGKELERVELNQNVVIESVQDNGRPAKMRAQYAVYEKPSERFELKSGVEIVTSEEGQVTTARGSEAVYLQSAGKVSISGGAEMAQGSDLVKGDVLNADLYPNKKLKIAIAKGNAYLKQQGSDRTTEVNAAEIVANFGENERISNANVTRDSRVVITPNSRQEYSVATISAPRSIKLSFRDGAGESLLSQILTDGRTVVYLAAAPGRANSSNRRLTADTINTTLHPNGKDIAKLIATGNAELFVEPIKPGADVYRTTVTAAKFDCDFFESGNDVRVCVAQTKAKGSLQPTIPSEKRGGRTLISDRMTANFDRQTSDIQRFEAVGTAKFSELDRNGTASLITYERSDEVVRLRGSEPTVWDSRGRAKAVEIDWDTKNNKSFLRRKVSTTYYNQKQTGGAAPFVDAKSPVFVTADQAQFDHSREVGIYSGNARAWQDNNYVRSDTLFIAHQEQRMDAEGRVQSLLYSAKRRENGKETQVPAYAAANKMSYSGVSRVIRYEGNVDIRQGVDRITSGSADIHLNESQEVRKTIVDGGFKIVQPGRLVTGTWGQYDNVEEVIALKGEPARVVDAAKGASEGSQLTVSLKENRVVNQGASKPGASGRTRTVYKVKPN